jgi:hypothetical protein
MSKIFASCLLSLTLFGLVACGGGGSGTPTPAATPIPTPTPTPTPAALAVSPAAFTVALNGSQQLTASGPGTPVTWSVNGVTGGNITTTGSISPTGFYQAPAGFATPGTITVTVTATSAADATKTASSTASVVYPNRNKDTQPLPVKLGSSGGNVNDVSASGCCIGTLGSLIDRGGTKFILSNNHVLARSDQAVIANHEVIAQPGAVQCFTATNNVATLTETATLKAATATTGGVCAGADTPFCGVAPKNVDAAIATINSPASVDATGTILELGAAATSTSIPDAAPSATIVPKANITVGLAVAKSGRTTGLTCSTVQTVGNNFQVDYTATCGGPNTFTSVFTNQVFVGGAAFSGKGDSGSLIVTSGSAQPVALLYAGSSTGTNPGTVGNPIEDVLAAFNNGTAPTVVGGADHAVSCAATALAPNSTQVGSASTLTASQRQVVTNVRERHSAVIMSDPAIRAVSVGASADNPQEGALVIEVAAPTRSPIPPLIEGVRTRVISAQAAPDISAEQMKTALAVKDANSDRIMAQPGIQGIGVGRSRDNPAETAIAIFTITGVEHPPIPATIDGMRTQIFESGRFRAY